MTQTESTIAADPAAAPGALQLPSDYGALKARFQPIFDDIAAGALRREQERQHFRLRY